MAFGCQKQNHFNYFLGIKPNASTIKLMALLSCPSTYTTDNYECNQKSNKSEYFSFNLEKCDLCYRFALTFLTNFKMLHIYQNVSKETIKFSLSYLSKPIVTLDNLHNSAAFFPTFPIN